MRRPRWTALLLWSALTLGCNSSLAPFQPEITNVSDNFQFQVTGLDGVSATRDYLWQNSGTVANVNQASAIGRGTGTLTIRDAQNTEVYSKDLSTNGTFQTSAGTSGTWRIHVVLSSVAGAVNFRVQKP